MRELVQYYDVQLHKGAINGLFCPASINPDQYKPRASYITRPRRKRSLPTEGWDIQDIGPDRGVSGEQKNPAKKPRRAEATPQFGGRQLDTSFVCTLPRMY